jgi:cell division protein FtsL
MLITLVWSAWSFLMLVAAAKGSLLLCLLLSLLGVVALQAKERDGTSAHAAKDEYEENLHIVWDEVRLEFAAASASKSIQILKGVYGEAKPGRLLVSKLTVFFASMLHTHALFAAIVCLRIATLTCILMLLEFNCRQSWAPQAPVRRVCSMPLRAEYLQVSVPD